MHHPRTALWFVVGIAALAGCAVIDPNPDHCANLDGDASCEARFGAELPYCEIGEGSCISEGAERFGCLAQRPTNECYSPCGDAKIFAEDSSCLDGSGSSSDSGSSGDDGGSTDTGSTSTDGSSSSTGPMPCTGNDECTEPDAPLCAIAVGECVACDQVDDGDAGCSELDAATPLCEAGQCVACTAEETTVCDAELLVCDTEANECTACTAHDQCESGACNIAAGTCFDPANVVHVDGDTGSGADYADVTTAVAAFDAGASFVVVVHELDGAGSYQGALTIDQGKTVALMAAPGESPVVQGTGGNPGLRVEGNETTVYIERVHFVGNTGAEGVVVDGATADIRRSRIVQNAGGGLRAENGASVYVENCFVGGAIDSGVVSLSDSDGTVLYSTLGASLGTTTAFACTGASTASIRNSIVVSRADAPELACSEATVSYSVTEGSTKGEGNVAVGDVETSWFADYNSGDFHLTTAPVTIANTAQWQAGDPTTDIDGNPRPDTDGTPDFAGADVP